MKLFKSRLLILILMLAFSTASLSGCNNENPDNQTENADEAPEDNADDDNQDNPNEDSPNQENPDTPSQTPMPVADKSPVAISRINPDNPVYPNVSGAPADPSTVTPTAPGEEEQNEEDLKKQEDPHYHEPTPNLFPIDFCQVEVNGVYDSDFAKSLVEAINAARVDYMIGTVERNTSLLACADIRCKEQSYFVGHFRPNGLPWNSVSYDYAQGECIAVDYRTAADVVEAWLSVNDTRIQLMNPDYTKIGTSVYNIDGTLYIAAIFGY